MTSAPSRFALAALLAALALAPATASAQGKGAKKKAAVKPACGLRVLPMAPGFQWTYQYFVPEGVQLPPGVRIQDPASMTVKVVKIEKSGDKTIISLEESYRKVVVKSQLECDKKGGLIVPPESFFFAGQPGGGLQMTLGKIERKAETNVFAGGSFKGEAFEELKTSVTRIPSEGSGAQLTPAKLEIERKMVVNPNKEVVESGLKSHKANRLTVNVTGRATLDTTPDKPFNMPQLDVAMFFEQDVGLVQVRNSLGQGWKLSEMKTE